MPPETKQYKFFVLRYMVCAHHLLFRVLGRFFHSFPYIKSRTSVEGKTLELVNMKKLVGAAILFLVFASMFCGIAMASTSGDENYNDYSKEYSDGEDNAPDDGMQSAEARTRFKDV